MQLNSLHDLFIDQLRDLYDAESQIVAALPKMSSAASSRELRQAFQHHLQQSREHLRRLEDVFDDLGQNPIGEHCPAMEGLIQEGEKIIMAGGDTSVKDAALIAAAQRVEHYEMAGYGAVRTYAKELGYKDAEKLLQQTLNEEGEADKLLTKLAEGGFLKTGINEEAKTSMSRS
ncbi:MAG: ferritin-like domain-containing protein [Anaerolineales bacterium]|nr:ferritin-like domain-containing protein [Anaerolineales bacterium]